jgi:protein ImuB
MTVPTQTQTTPVQQTSVRTAVLIAPHWSVVAAGVPADEPAAVVFANRVVEISPAAATHGVEIGMRRRESQGRCPSLEVIEHDAARDARKFESVVAALESLTPRVEILRPGRCSFPTLGPSRYFGGDAALSYKAAALIDEAVARVIGSAASADDDASLLARVGVADGLFGAGLAAALPRERRVTIIPPGETRAFLAGFPISALGQGSAIPDPDDLIDLLWRLGIARLGDLAELPADDLLARFGLPGVIAHRLACGLDERPPDTRRVPPDLVVEVDLEPPADRVDTVAFVAKTLADQIDGRLARDGLACTRVIIEAETESGQVLSRAWRHENRFTPASMTDRVRWQLDGWFHSSQRPTGGVNLLRLIPDEVVPDEGRQLGFWGGQTQGDERAARALARVQGILGADAVTVPELRGGRRPLDHEGRASITGVALGPDRTLALPGVAEAPWPGRLPAPSPAKVLPDPVPVRVTASDGAVVSVDGRGDLSASPSDLTLKSGKTEHIRAWAGPWPIDERWWDEVRSRRQARIQVILDDHSAHLLAVENGAWHIEATYD